MKQALLAASVAMLVACSPARDTGTACREACARRRARSRDARARGD
jgi:hypothetical protein